MTKKLIYVEVTKCGWVLAENDDDARSFADKILETEYFKDVDVSPYTEENLRASGWNKTNLVYHNGTDDITVEDALFVDKKARVTLRNGEMIDCDIKFYPIRTSTYPYIISYVIGNSRNENTYTREGRLDLNTSTSLRDIIKIEELKPMKKYEQLENQVAEIQKEIDRLKREEKKENYPNLKPVEVTRTVCFTPEEYFKYCEENNEEPTEEGYVEYYSNEYTLGECFCCQYTQEIKEVEN